MGARGARQPWGSGGHAQQHLLLSGPDGLWRAGQGRVGAGWVGPRARPNPVGLVLFFFRIYFNAKTNSRKVEKLLKGTKNTPKITKITGKFLEID
jgi:hypothetical protein